MTWLIALLPVLIVCGVVLHIVACHQRCRRCGSLRTARCGLSNRRYDEWVCHSCHSFFSVEKEDHNG